jgi:HK97 gp10 family phage protein
MPYRIKGKVDGLDATLKALEGLRKALANKLLRRALNKARSILAKTAKAKAPRETGLLKKSIGGKVKIYPSGVGVAVVGPRAGFKKEVTRKRNKRFPTTAMANPIKYAHLVELGTSHSKAQPFLGTALSANQSQIKEAMADVIRKGLEDAKKG